MANYSSSYTGAQIDSAVGRANSTDVTAGTVTASKAVVVDANSDISGFRNITATGQIQAATINLTGDTTIGDGDTDNITINADVNSNIIPNTDNTFDLGSSSKQWKDLYVNGIGYIDQLGTDADPIAIYASSGEIDGTVIGSESAAAGTFTTLTASGDVNFDSNTLFVDASENRVGIGTDSPESILHIEGSGVDSLRFGNIGTSSNSALRISRDDTSISSGNPLGFLEFGGKDNTSNVDTAHAYISAVASGTHAAGDNPTDLTFGTTPSSSSTISERMRIDGSGNVGIGETSPDQLLHVKSSTGSARILVESVTDNAGITLDCGTDGAGSEQSTILFNENGSAKWLIGKDTGNDFYIYDYASNTTVLEILDNSVFKIAHNDNRNITLAEGGGNVGIGVTDPGNLLEIDTGGVADKGIDIMDGASTAAQLRDAAGSGAQVGILRLFTTGDVENVRLRGDTNDNWINGKLGIGTTSPDSWEGTAFGAKLQVEGQMGSRGVLPAFIFDETDQSANARIMDIAMTGGLLSFRKYNDNGSSASTMMAIERSSGNVGIGTTSPSRLLDLETTNAGGSTLMSLVSATDGNCQLLFGDTSSDTQGKVLYNNNGDYMAFTANDSERMRILSGGQVMINETLNAEMSIGLTINQGANDNEILSLKSSDVAHGMTTLTETDTYLSIRKGSASNGGVNMQCFADGTSGTALHLQGAISTSADTAKSTSAGGCLNIYGATKTGTNRTVLGSNQNIAVIKNDSATRFIFDAEGSGHADVEWTTYSDSRLKLNQEQIPYGLNEINQLQPKIYDRYSGDVQNGEVTLEETSRRQIGFIAQEVKEIIPELVKDVDESHSFYSMDDGKIVAVLVKAVQELSAKVEALENA